MADKLLVASVLLVLVGVDRITDLALLPALVILCRELLVSGLREFLAEVRVGVPVSRLAKWKTVLQMIAIGFLVVGSSGPDLIGFAPVEIGVIGLWIAAALTLITGYDYLRASLKHMTRADTAAE
jgi:cardiolipin synthase